MAANTLDRLGEHDWVLMLARACRLTFKPGEEIIKEGAHGKAIYLIRSGMASVQVTRGDRKMEIATLGPGEVCGDMSFLMKTLTSAAVVAKEELVADEMDGKELDALFESFPGVGLRFYHSLAVVLARRLRDTSNTLAGTKS
jgi:CRP-like cAMP-binding protein